MSRYEIRRLAPPEIRPQWGMLLPYVERALEGGFDEMEPDDVLAAAEAGDMQIWAVGHVAVFVTQLIEYPRRTVLMAAFCGGTEGPQWFSDMDLTLDTFAAENGCQEVRWIGRDGWIKVLRGYEVIATVARKRIWVA